MVVVSFGSVLALARYPEKDIASLITLLRALSEKTGGEGRVSEFPIQITDDDV